MLEWWRQRASEVEKGERVILLAFVEPGSGRGEGREAGEGGEEVVVKDEDGRAMELAGYVMLGCNAQETSSHQGQVGKLAVHRGHRRKGVAEALMRKVEEVARGRGLSLLVCAHFILFYLSP